MAAGNTSDEQSRVSFPQLRARAGEVFPVSDSMSRFAMQSSVMNLSFDRDEQILFVEFRGVRLDTREQVEAAFNAVRSFWRQHCGGRKVYALIDYANFHLRPELTDFYAQCVARIVDECTITTVRYSDDIAVRATMRVVGMKIHRPSNLYSSLAEAIEVVRGLRANRIVVAHPTLP
jgi:propionate CoA-transferase